jgi:hypothetical protein
VAAGVIFVVLWIALVAMWVAALVSLARFPESAFTAVGRTKTSTLVLVGITGWVGGGYYWIVIKRELAPYRNVPA